MREDLSPELQKQLGAVLRDSDYEIAPFLRTMFLSRDFYSPAAMGAQIKGPVELIVSTYRRLGLTALPGIPDINSASGELGQLLLNPPTVAGWAQGRAWITPATLLGRGNFARDVLFPDQIDFIDPNLDPGAQIREVNARILRGLDIAAATTEETPGGSDMMGERAMANVEAKQEEFNTRLASLHGWQQAVRKVKPVVRAPAQFSLTEIVLAARARTTADAVDVLLVRFLSVPLDDDARATLVAFLDAQLGTSDIGRAQHLSGGAAAADHAPDHEQAGISARLTKREGNGNGCIAGMNIAAARRGATSCAARCSGPAWRCWAIRRPRWCSAPRARPPRRRRTSGSWWWSNCRAPMTG